MLNGTILIQPNKRLWIFSVFLNYIQYNIIFFYNFIFNFILFYLKKNPIKHFNQKWGKKLRVCVKIYFYFYLYKKLDVLKLFFRLRWLCNAMEQKPLKYFDCITPYWCSNLEDAFQKSYNLVIFDWHCFLIRKRN